MGTGLTEDFRRLLGFDDGPESNAEISLKIKPLGAVSGGATGAGENPTLDSSLASAPTVAGGETGTGAGLAAGAPAPASAAPPTTPGAVTPAFNTVVPTGQQVQGGNPQLVTHPLGKQTDDQYEAAVAQLVHGTNTSYANILKELGFLDETGKFLPGTLETQAARDRFELERQRELARRSVDEGAMRGNTVFSGRRAKLLDDASSPYDTGIANLGTQLSQALAQRYGDLGNVTKEFELQRNLLLSDAAERIAALIAAKPVGGGEGALPGGEGAPPQQAAAAPISPELQALIDMEPELAAYIPGAPAPRKATGIGGGNVRAM